MTNKLFLLSLTFFILSIGITQNNHVANSENVSAVLEEFKSKLEYFHLKEPDKDSVLAIIERGEAYTAENNNWIKYPTNDTAKANTFARYFDQVGYFYYDKSDYLSALRYFSWALGIYEQTNDAKGEGFNAHNLAAIFRQLGDATEALRYANRALDLFVKINNAEGEAITLYTLAIVHRENAENEIADELAEQSLSIYNSIDDVIGKARVYNLLAGIYRDKNEDEEALAYYKKALEIYEEMGHLQGMANLLNNIGVIFRDKGAYDLSRDYIQRAIYLSDSADYNRGMVFGMVNLAEVYYSDGNYAEAKKIGKEAIALAKKIMDIESVRKGAEFLIKVYKHESNWEKAFEMHELVFDTERELSQQKKEKMLEYEAIKNKYEQERLLEEKEQEKERSIADFQRDRQRILLLAAIIIIALLLLSLFIGYYKLKETKRKNLQIQQQSDERKLLLQEVHHRVKNNFQIVSSLLRLQSYTLDNKEFLKDFEEAIMRINAMSVVHDIIYKQEAFSEIQPQLYFEKLLEQLKRLSDKSIETEVVISCGYLKIETLIHLGIITNELFINSIKYGFQEKGKKPRIKIVLAKKTDRFELNYFENGKGLSKKEYENSFGMDLINTLIEQHDGEVVIEDPSDIWNTHIRIEFFESD
jgi:two-component sensor histidine kinase